jgi:hypothetical protein
LESDHFHIKYNERLEKIRGFKNITKPLEQYMNEEPKTKHEHVEPKE